MYVAACLAWRIAESVWYEHNQHPARTSVKMVSLDMSEPENVRSGRLRLFREAVDKDDLGLNNVSWSCTVLI